MNSSKTHLCERCSDGYHPECSQIEGDYPAINGSDYDGYRETITEAFCAVRKMRCNFLKWLITLGFAKEDGYFFNLPEGITLRHPVMIEMENRIMECPASISDLCAEYTLRSRLFFENQRMSLLKGLQK